MLKNAIFYRLTQPFEHTAEQLQAKLQEQAFAPCKSQELSRYGWESPCKHREQLTVEASGGIMIAARKEEKILPTPVINESLAEKVNQIETDQVRKVYKKERDQLKDEIILDLLPRAFSKYTVTRAIIIPLTGWVIVDASSHKRAEELLSFLRGTLGSLPITLPDVLHSPSAVMSHWLEKNEFPPAFELMDSCVLKDNVLEGGVIRIKGQALADEEFIAHLEAGKRVESLALQWEESFTFTLKDDLSIKTLKPTDQFVESHQTDANSEVELFDSDLAITVLEFNKLIPALIEAFGGPAE